MSAVATVTAAPVVDSKHHHGEVRHLTIKTIILRSCDLTAVRNVCFVQDLQLSNAPPSQQAIHATAVNVTTPIATAGAETATSTANYTAALEFLNTPNRVESVDAVAEKLDQLGILEADDLTSLSENDIRDFLLPLIKKAQRKKFMALFQLEYVPV